MYTISYAASMGDGSSFPSWIAYPLVDNKLSLTPAIADVDAYFDLSFDAIYNDASNGIFSGADLGPDIFDFMTIQVTECMVTSVVPSVTLIQYYKGTTSPTELNFTPTPACGYTAQANSNS